MNENNATTGKRGMAIAVAAAISLLIATGVGYRVLAWHLAGPGGGTPLPPGALERLSMQIGNWVGQDVKLTEAVVEATDTDAHINRRYLRNNRAESVSLYVAYGVRARDLMPHRPEVCYPGNGWTLKDTRDAELLLADGVKLQCRVLRFARVGLATENVTVLNYYIVDGRYCPDVSLLRSKAWQGQSSIRYMAQVQISCSGRGQQSPESSVGSVRAFATDSARAIHDLFSHPGGSSEAANVRSHSEPPLKGEGNG